MCYLLVLSITVLNVFLDSDVLHTEFHRDLGRASDLDISDVKLRPHEVLSLQVDYATVENGIRDCISLELAYSITGNFVRLDCTFLLFYFRARPF